MSQVSVIQKLVSVAIYPVTLSLSILAFAYARMLGLPLAVASYGAVVLGAILIVVAEYSWTYKPSWTPKKPVVLVDLAYMILIQMALPKILTLSLALWLLHQMNQWGIDLGVYWPHQSSIALQVV